MRVLSSLDVKKIDQEAEKKLNISSEYLMNQVGHNMALMLLHFLKDKSLPIVFYIGPGNNGGDGLVLARELLGCACKNIYLHIPEQGKSTLWQKQFSFVSQLKSGQRIDGINSFLNNNKHKRVIIIDALFGVGCDRDLENGFKSSVEHIYFLKNQNKKNRIISLDVPSGLNSDTGKVMGQAVQADYTFTVTAPKIGFFEYDAKKYLGTLCLIPLAVPAQFIKKYARKYFVFNRDSALKILRSQSSAKLNKSNRGHLLIVAGSRLMPGALHLASEAASRVGAGYVSIASDILDEKTSTHLKPDFIKVAIEKLDIADFKKYSAVLIGPGLGFEQSDQVANFIKKLISFNFKKVVVDADALKICRDYNLFPLPKTWIITPHEGELSRLIDIPATIIQKERVKSVLLAAHELGCLVLLKGAGSLVSEGNRVVVNSSGNSALAKAGTGDVLSGLVAGFLANGYVNWKALLLGTYLHGLIANRFVRVHAHESLMASDLLGVLGPLLKEMHEEKILKKRRRKYGY